MFWYYFVYFSEFKNLKMINIQHVCQNWEILNVTISNSVKEFKKSTVFFFDNEIVHPISMWNKYQNGKKLKMFRRDFVTVTCQNKRLITFSKTNLTYMSFILFSWQHYQTMYTVPFTKLQVKDCMIDMVHCICKFQNSKYHCCSRQEWNDFLIW